MREILRRVMLVAAVAAATVLAACSTATTGARSSGLSGNRAAPVVPGWRIVQRVPNLGVGGLAVLGPRDAWQAGDECADSQCDGTKSTMVVRHWDGTAWRTLAVPKEFVDSPADQGAQAIVATSASDAWVFAGRGASSVEYTHALHWTGSGWAAPVRLNAGIEAAVAPSATDVWAFGSGNTLAEGNYGAHFDGRTWTQQPFPLEGTAASALSPNDIWVGGSLPGGCGCDSPLGIEHWDGHTWRDTPLPGLGLGTMARVNSGIAYLVGIAAVAPGDAWADIADIGSDNPKQPGTFVLHWNGTAWTRAAFPYPGSAMSSVTPDGEGGIWLATSTGAGLQSRIWLCHYDGRHWTRTALPNVPSWDGSQQPLTFSLSWIPGTRSLWAVGEFDTGEVVFKYGP
jgi:hypothetical protein